MPFNLPGLLVPLQLIFRPRLVQPFLVVKDLRNVDFRALYNAGYRGAVFDKDNCLTVPHVDHLVPDLEDSWAECKNVFGTENIIIVSNSSGSRSDSGHVKAESVSHHLGVPVLRHGTLKPAYACINSIRSYFSSLPKPVNEKQLLVVGDRIFTDVVLCNRMRASPERLKQTDATSDVVTVDGPSAILVEKLWKGDEFVPRFVERTILRLVNRWTAPGGEDKPSKSFVRSQS